MYVSFPYLWSDKLSSPARGVYISQLIRYARACSAYDQLLSRGKLLANKLLVHGSQHSFLKAAFCKFYDWYNDLVVPYNLTLSHICCLTCFKTIVNPFYSMILTTDWSIYPILNIGQQGMGTPPWHLIPTLVYPGARVCRALIVCDVILDYEIDCSSLSFPFHVNTFYTLRILKNHHYNASNIMIWNW